MIKDNLQSQISQSLKAGDEIRVTTLRMLSASLTNAEIENKRQKLTTEQEIAVVKAEAKKRKEAAQIYADAGETGRAQKEEKELEILREFLPKEIGDQEIEKAVIDAIDKTNASTTADTGKVMGAVMQDLKGKASGDRVAKIVSQKLQNKND